jgi:hypothetical protein
MRQKTIKLIEPVEFAGQTYTQLTFRKLKVKHMLDIDWTEVKSPIAQFSAMAAASAGVDIGVIHELDMEDFVVIQELLEGFSPQGNRDKDQPTQG